MRIHRCAAWRRSDQAARGARRRRPLRRLAHGDRLRAADRCVFLHGSAKSARDNIDVRELDDLKKLAKFYLAFTDEQLALAIRETELREVMCDDQEEE